ncbi:MAG: hypothetical protein K2I10_00315 [Lachnospiraceae bacterium]|nr:hypothetical protein [Lachnospiraceae bacterium]
MNGFDSELFQISVPVLASFPYSTAWINDYQSGFLKEYKSYKIHLSME